MRNSYDYRGRVSVLVAFNTRDAEKTNTGTGVDLFSYGLIATPRTISQVRGLDIGFVAFTPKAYGMNKKARSRIAAELRPGFDTLSRTHREDLNRIVDNFERGVFR